MIDVRLIITVIYIFFLFYYLYNIKNNFFYINYVFNVVTILSDNLKFKQPNCWQSDYVASSNVSQIVRNAHRYISAYKAGTLY